MIVEHRHVSICLPLFSFHSVNMTFSGCDTTPSVILALGSSILSNHLHVSLWSIRLCQGSHLYNRLRFQLWIVVHDVWLVITVTMTPVI